MDKAGHCLWTICFLALQECVYIKKPVAGKLSFSDRKMQFVISLYPRNA